MLLLTFFYHCQTSLQVTCMNNLNRSPLISKCQMTSCYLLSVRAIVHYALLARRQERTTNKVIPALSLVERRNLKNKHFILWMTLMNCARKQKKSTTTPSYWFWWKAPDKKNLNLNLSFFLNFFIND